MSGVRNSGNVPILEIGEGGHLIVGFISSHREGIIFQAAKRRWGQVIVRHGSNRLR